MHLVMIGGSDAGISAALRARELDPGAEVSVIVADAYPNFSICGIPYYVSGEVTHWRNLAHRTTADLEATGMSLRLDTTARRIDVAGRKLLVTAAGGAEELLSYDKLIVGTGAVPVRPPIGGLTGPDILGPADGVHLLHSMGDTFALMRTLEEASPATAVIVGAGYIGLEMADALTTRGLQVIQMEQLPEVLPTVDPQLGQLVHAQLAARGVEVLTGTTVRQITRAAEGEGGRLRVDAAAADGTPVSRLADTVLVVVGVRPDTTLAADAGAALGVRGAIAVDRSMRTNLPDVYAAGYSPVTVQSEADDHKAYYPGSHRITMRFTGDRGTGQLLGVQLFGHRHAEIAKRIDIAATAIFHSMTIDGLSDLDLSYTPPLGSPWEAIQMGAHAWVRQASQH
jgi:NADPH-dependent 2,4-dienoyl-CoA reductase/sulfur reductase-like enzyme